jgi:hypothetical protein
VKSQKDLAKPHSQISTKFFKNTIIIFCLELWYSAEKFSTRCSYPAVCKENNIFPKGIMKSYGVGFFFPEHSYKGSPLKLLLPFLKYILGIWGVRFDNYFLVYCNLNLVYSDEFSGYLFPTAEGRAIDVYFSQPVNCR